MGKHREVASFINQKPAANKTKQNLYREEKAAIREFFSKQNAVDFSLPANKAYFDEFAKKVIETAQDTLAVEDVMSTYMTTIPVQPGDTAVFHEISGPSVYYSTYGAAPRFGRVQLKEYTATANRKEIAMNYLLQSIQTGKYSPSEVGEFIANLISAWRNRLLFTTTLGGIAAFQNAGAQTVSGASLSVSIMNSAFNLLDDNAEVRAIVGRRKAITILSNIANAWSDASKDEFKRTGQVGMYAGVPVVKLTSFTDPEYGSVQPFTDTDLWIFSEANAGAIALTQGLTTFSETKPVLDSLEQIVRWEDGIAIWKNNRIARIYSIS